MLQRNNAPRHHATTIERIVFTHMCGVRACVSDFIEMERDLHRAAASQSATPPQSMGFRVLGWFYVFVCGVKRKHSMCRTVFGSVMKYGIIPATTRLYYM